MIKSMSKQYYKYKIEDLFVIRKIVTIHYFEFDKDFTYPSESHDFWEMIHACCGERRKHHLPSCPSCLAA